MTRARIAGGAAALLLFALVVALGLFAARLLRDLDGNTDAAASPAIPGSPATSTKAHQGFLYGRVTTRSGTAYEGRLRFGGDEEAFWGDYFNGFKEENPWAAEVPPERLTESRPVTVLGVEITRRERKPNLGRPFMARFGDIQRVAPSGRELVVTLKSGTGFVLNRYDADDFADGVRVWDDRHGVVDLGERRIRAIEFLPTADLGGRPGPAARHRSDAAGELHRLRPVGPAIRRRLRRAPGPDRRRRPQPALRRHPHASRATRPTAPW